MLYGFVPFHISAFYQLPVLRISPLLCALLSSRYHGCICSGPCKQSHLHRNWWSLPTNSSLKKTHHILPSFGGAVKSKTLPCTNFDEQPKFEEFECKQATCHCCKEAVDAFPCCRFHVFSLLDFRKVYMQSSTVYRSRKLGSLSSVIKINI